MWISSELIIETAQSGKHQPFGGDVLAVLLYRCAHLAAYYIDSGLLVSLFPSLIPLLTSRCLMLPSGQIKGITWLW